MTKSQASRVDNRLNDLDGKSWVKATKSWFVINPPRRTNTQIAHPAKYPEDLVRRFVRFFTQEDSWVLDPFAGVASTIVACKSLGRNSLGVELNPEFVEAGTRMIVETQGRGENNVISGDSMKLVKILTNHFGDAIPKFDYVITSPPYWDMLNKSRGGNDSSHKERKEKGLNFNYSDSSLDFGNIEDYEDYIESIGLVFDEIDSLLNPKAYLTVVVQNMRDVDGTLRTIAWDIARRLSRTYDLRQEQIWCQDNKRLGCWGYPTTYVSNVHHHYCLMFQKK